MKPVRLKRQPKLVPVEDPENDPLLTGEVIPEPELPAGQLALPRPALFAVLSTLLPEKEARLLAGYSPNNRDKPDISKYVYEVGEIRKKLTSIPGLVSYIDQIAKAMEIRDDPNSTFGIKMDAIKEINKMQGYLAPQKVEMESRVKISGAVLELKAIMQGGLTPAAILEEKKRREIAYESVEKEDDRET